MSSPFEPPKKRRRPAAHRVADSEAVERAVEELSRPSPPLDTETPGTPSQRSKSPQTSEATATKRPVASGRPRVSKAPSARPGAKAGRRQRRKGSGSRRTTLSLDEVSATRLEQLSESWGLSKSAVVSLLIRQAGGDGAPGALSGDYAEVIALIDNLGAAIRRASRGRGGKR